MSVLLGTAAAFAVLGASTVTNTGPSIINGDLGVFPGNAIVGFPPGIVNGVIHPGDAVAAQAQSDLTVAYNTAAGLPCPPANDLTGIDLGGLNLVPGVYCFSSSAQLTGNLTLNALGDPNAQFVFQIGTTLTTASGSSVALINGAQACNVFWQVGSSATLGTATSFVGNVMALASITATTGATVNGRLLARTAAVTLDTNLITAAFCAAPGQTSPTIVKSTNSVAVEVGQTFTYSLTVNNSNPGNALLTNVVLLDTLPANVTFVSGSVPGGTISVSGNTVRFDISAMAAGTVVVATITVLANTPGTAHNSFTIVSAEFPSAASNIVATTIGLTPSPPGPGPFPGPGGPTPVVIVEINPDVVIVDQNIPNNIVVVDNFANRFLNINDNTGQVGINKKDKFKYECKSLCTGWTIKYCDGKCKDWCDSPCDKSCRRTCCDEPDDPREPINITAFLSGGNNPTGTITFGISGPNFNTGITVPVINGVATLNFDLGALLPGTHTVIARYSGDINNNPSVSTPATFIVRNLNLRRCSNRY